ncbi:MAG TPA: hypothetical protein VL860_14800, partial [Planctomycetota bacterium]|nr:hypothetical protein [Planctomycetota bacterium]
MNRFRWIALCACTLFFLYLTRAGLPPRLPLIPARGLAVTLRAAAIVNAPRHVCRRLENSALVDGLFTYDPAQAEADRSKEARNAGLPALRPPVIVPMEQRQRLDAALAWLRPEAAAVVLVDTDTRRETWLGVQGGRTGLAGRLAAWFVPNIKVVDSLWMRIANQPLDPSPTPSAPTPANAPVDWLRPNRADIA